MLVTRFSFNWKTLNKNNQYSSEKSTRLWVCVGIINFKSSVDIKHCSNSHQYFFSIAEESSDF